MNKNPEFDIVVFGASGYTGALITAYLAREYGVDSDLKWAIAGRSASKLTEVHRSLGLAESTPVLIADSADIASLEQLVKRTRLLVSATGPYQLYGSALVEACAHSGTDYVDVCGEPVWMHSMIDKYHQLAKNSGARILFSCGFDSVPSDLGVFRLQQLAYEHCLQPVSRVKGRVISIKATLSAGSVASINTSDTTAENDHQRSLLLADPFALTPGFSGPEQPSASAVIYDEDLASWSAPFLMATVNTKNVHRSNYLGGFRYGADFVYDEMTCTGDGDKGHKAAIEYHALGGLRALDKGVPKPGEGPSREEREAGHYTFVYSGILSDNRSVKVTASSDLDPGYESSARIVVESAMSLLYDNVQLDGGMWTPASALGNKLITRLNQKHIVNFDHEIFGSSQ